MKLEFKHVKSYASIKYEKLTLRYVREEYDF
jgi:hypothetical protein